MTTPLRFPMRTHLFPDLDLQAQGVLRARLVLVYSLYSAQQRWGESAASFKRMDLRGHGQRVWCAQAGTRTVAAKPFAISAPIGVSSNNISIKPSSDAANKSSAPLECTLQDASRLMNSSTFAGSTPAPLRSTTSFGTKGSESGAERAAASASEPQALDI